MLVAELHLDLMLEVIAVASSSSRNVSEKLRFRKIGFPFRML
jgi:hypothetical protein